MLILILFLIPLILIIFILRSRKLDATQKTASTLFIIFFFVLGIYFLFKWGWERGRDPALRQENTEQIK